MSGTHEEIVAESSKLFGCPEEKRIFQVLTAAVLRNQLIRPEALEDIMFRVALGTGMGLLCSGELADASFHSMVEEPFATRPRVQHEYGAKLYCRFKDDGLIVFRGRSSSSTQGLFLREMMRRSRFFKIKLESRTVHSTIMLDVELKKDDEWRRSGRLSFYCHSKPSTIFSPLSISSAHPYHVHLAWPNAMTHRLRTLSCTQSAARKQIASFTESLRSTSGIDCISLRRSSAPQCNYRPKPCFLVLPYV